MATTGESADEEDNKVEELDREICELRLAKKDLFEKARPINDELERIAKRERECTDERCRLTVKKHNREREKPSLQRVAELEFELHQAKCENVKLSETVKHLEEYLDHAEKKVGAQIQNSAELETLSAGKVANGIVQTRSGDNDGVVVVELWKRLSQTNELLGKSQAELNETRQRLSDVQERLTVSEHVTAATQQRELLECGNSEQLQLEMTSQHQPPIHSGILSSFYS